MFYMTATFGDNVCNSIFIKSIVSETILKHPDNYTFDLRILAVM